MSYEPTPGSVRIRSASPSPYDIHAEVMQRDGTWLDLRLCAVAITIRTDMLITASIEVEPSSIDMMARLIAEGA